jgi:hypothetical protein
VQTTAAVNMDEPKTQEKTKQEKPKRNFWADATPKNDDSEADALKTFKYP